MGLASTVPVNDFHCIVCTVIVSFVHQCTVQYVAYSVYSNVKGRLWGNMSGVPMAYLCVRMSVCVKCAKVIISVLGCHYSWGGGHLVRKEEVCQYVYVCVCTLRECEYVK